MSDDFTANNLTPSDIDSLFMLSLKSIDIKVLVGTTDSRMSGGDVSRITGATLSTSSDGKTEGLLEDEQATKKDAAEKSKKYKKALLSRENFIFD